MADKVESVGIRKLKSQLSDYVRRARNGERIQVTSHGEVVAELRPPEPVHDVDTPPGLLELKRLGIARSIVRNDPSAYGEVGEPLLDGLSSIELLDWERGER